jgi:hypothetical protein
MRLAFPEDANLSTTFELLADHTHMSAPITAPATKSLSRQRNSKKEGAAQTVPLFMYQCLPGDEAVFAAAAGIEPAATRLMNSASLPRVQRRHRTATCCPVPVLFQSTDLRTSLFRSSSQNLQHPIKVRSCSGRRGLSSAQEVACRATRVAWISRHVLKRHWLLPFRKKEMMADTSSLLRISPRLIGKSFVRVGQPLG